MANTVVGVFDNVKMAEEAAQELIYHGFSSRNVDISATSENQGRGEEHKKGIGKFFDNLFGDSEESRNYSEVGYRGAVITVHAQSGEESDLASKILDQYGAVDANERGNYYRGMPDSDRGIYNKDTNYEYNKDRNTENERNANIDRDRDLTMQDRDRDRDFDIQDRDRDMDIEDRDRNISNTDQSIPVVEEDMQVGKRMVEGDTVRVRSRIIERPVEQNLRLRVEKVYVERKPVNRPATEEDMAAFKEGTIEATEREEIPMVSKEARVVEEVKLKKEVEEREKPIRGSVKKQDVNVERKKKDRTKSPDEEAL